MISLFQSKTFMIIVSGFLVFAPFQYVHVLCFPVS